MKAISIRQPWAWLICEGIKTIENRSKPTSYRGEILIHTGLNVDAAFPRAWAEGEAGKPIPLTYTQLGGVVGIAEIVDCIDGSNMSEAERKKISPWFFGPYGYVLKNARHLDFKQERGQLGIFEIRDDYAFLSPEAKKARDDELNRKFPTSSASFAYTMPARAVLPPIKIPERVPEWKKRGEIHPFEAAGLGKAPYELTESRTVERESCQFCNQPLIYCFTLESADRKRFQVGCECVKKVETGALLKKIEADYVRMQKARQAVLDKNAVDKLELDLCALRVRLEALPFSRHSGPARAGYNLYTFVRREIDHKVRYASPKAVRTCYRDMIKLALKEIENAKKTPR